MSRVLTVTELQDALPKQMKMKATQKLVDMVNIAVSDPDVRESFLDNMISYSSILKEGRYRIDQYINAVRYVSFKLFGESNNNAYMKTFPTKWQRWIDEDKANNHITAYVRAYHTSKLVQGIMEQTLIPTHIMNAHHFQQAINVQASLMNDENVSPKVRSDAANSLLTHLKAPETKKIELDIGQKDDGTIRELNDTLAKLAQQQKSSVINGNVNAQQLAHSRIIEGEKVE